ncbi:MAG TPA: flagellar basal body L-ring protein FlgH [Caulobacteraceae bacterium]|nr:flagellar basal body L-ring protein FlgH [Caulobacteraceae bacterium]
MRPATFAAALLALPALTACGSVNEAVHGPKLGPMAYPAPLVGQNQPEFLSGREPPPMAPTANSLWRTGARTFFNDQRAGRVGDILTVLVSIDDSAKTSNTTNTGITTSNSMGVPNFFGLESTIGKVLPSAYDPSKMITTNTAGATNGTGGVNRSEAISLTIAAVVTQVLPNGNLVIQGTQEVKTNDEVRQLTVAGIVRPEDISSSNTILSSQIAEARINYGGRGDISAVQKTPVGTSLLQRFWPF